MGGVGVSVGDMRSVVGKTMSSVKTIRSSVGGVCSSLGGYLSRTFKSRTSTLQRRLAMRDTLTATLYGALGGFSRDVQFTTSRFVRLSAANTDRVNGGWKGGNKE